MSEEEINKTLDETFKEDTQTIRERMKALMKSYDYALEYQVKQDKVINLMAKKIKAQDPFASVLDIDEKIIIGNFYKKVEEENGQ